MNDQATLWMADGLNDQKPKLSTNSGQTWITMTDIVDWTLGFAYTPAEIWQVGDPRGSTPNAAYSRNEGNAWTLKELKTTDNVYPVIRTIAPARTPWVE